MPDSLPEGEALRRAVRWISPQLEESETQPVMPLVNEATLRFDLTPRQSEYLIEFFRDARRARGG